MLAVSNVQFGWILIPLVSPKEVLRRSSAKKKMEGEIEQDEIDFHCMYILYPVDILDVTACQFGLQHWKVASKLLFIMFTCCLGVSSSRIITSYVLLLMYVVYVVILVIVKFKIAEWRLLNSNKFSNLFLICQIHQFLKIENVRANKWLLFKIEKCACFRRFLLILVK